MKFRLREQAVLFFSELRWFHGEKIAGSTNGFVPSFFLASLAVEFQSFFHKSYLLFFPVRLFFGIKHVTARLV
jgi:hypothetical protein